MDSNPGAPKLNEMTEHRPSKAKYFWITLLIMVVATPISLLVVFGMGQNSGREFSPDDFSRRSFQYNQVPGLDWVIIKKTYRDTTTNLEQDLIADKLIVPVTNQTKVWHLFRDSGDSSLPSHDCDARFLTDYLDMEDDDGNNYWTRWNEKHPLSAKVFWPRVADLARDEMYLKIPDLMQAAMDVDADQPAALEPVLDQLTAQIYLELGTIDLEMERLERSRHRLDRSIQILPSRKAYQTRSRCFAKLGNPTQSRQDQQQAESMPIPEADGLLEKVDE